MIRRNKELLLGEEYDWFRDGRRENVMQNKNNERKNEKTRKKL